MLLQSSLLCTFPNLVKITKQKRNTVTFSLGKWITEEKDIQKNFLLFNFLLSIHQFNTCFYKHDC